MYFILVMDLVKDNKKKAYFFIIIKFKTTDCVILYICQVARHTFLSLVKIKEEGGKFKSQK